MMPKQQSFFKPCRTDHGGSLAIGKRRCRRPLVTKKSLHLILRSDLAKNQRSLLRHRPLIEKVIRKAQRRFHIRVYRKAIVGNHLHLLIKGQTRQDMQNFFRVVSGHVAQGILKRFPLVPGIASIPGGASTKLGCAKNQRKFWSFLLYSRVVSWGREYQAVRRYIELNILEALQLVAYRPRPKSKLRSDSS